MDTLLSVDPGDTSGLVLCQTDGDSLFEVLERREFVWEEIVNVVDRFLVDAARRPSVVLIERVIPQGPEVRGLIAGWVTGAVIYVCRNLGIEYELRSTAYLPKGYTMLTQLGFKIPSPHERDAVAHALVYVLEKRLGRRP